jgi:hypothetical protein
MKKTGILFALVMTATTSAFAQNKMVDFFKMLPKEDQLGLSIVQKGGKYIVLNDVETPCKLTIDDKNGFLEIIDNGTGGGTNTLQIAQFKDAKGKTILAYSSYNFDGSYHDTKSAFYDTSKKMEIANYVFDFDMPEGAFQKEDLSTTEEEKYAHQQYVYYELPRQGLILKMHFGYSQADNDCQTGDKDACKFKAKFVPYLQFKWNKATGTFEQVK